MYLAQNQLRVTKEKVTQYLLNVHHPSGRSKAYFFMQCGYAIAAWQILAHNLCVHGASYAVAKQETSLFGEKYIVEGELLTVRSNTSVIRTVWFLKRNAKVITLVTAYPIKL